MPVSITLNATATVALCVQVFIVVATASRHSEGCQLPHLPSLLCHFATHLFENIAGIRTIQALLGSPIFFGRRPCYVWCERVSVGDGDGACLA